MSFVGRLFVISGGASGIGLAIAKRLWTAGASVAISDINNNNLADAKTQLQSGLSARPDQCITTSQVDVTKSAEVNDWITSIVREQGKLNGAVNAVGMSDGGGLLADKADRDFDFTIDVNLRGVFNCMRAQLNNMESVASIVNISSGAGIRGMGGVSLYTAAKHGVNGLTKAAAKEYGPMGIRVNSVCPGITNTPALANPVAAPFIDSLVKATPLGRMCSLEEVANVIEFLLSDKASFQNGSIITVDGGASC